MNFFQGPISYFKRVLPVIPVFFILLFFMLFLSDGTQKIIDFVGALTGLTLLIVIKQYRNKQRNLPKHLMTGWFLILGYWLIRTIFSDDTGYSIYSSIRMTCSFVIFYIFYCYSVKHDINEFAYTLSIFVSASLVLSVLATLKIINLPFYSQMNLLLPTFGHNHIMDLLYFIIPLSFMNAVLFKKPKHIMLALLFIAGSVFSLSRVGIVLTIITALIIWIIIRTKKEKIEKKEIIIPVIAGVLLTGLTLILYPKFVEILPFSIRPGYAKGTLQQDGRFEYWRQAIVSVKESALFGTGPGTFALTSKRLQDTPVSYSTYAHNEILEIASETGLIGLLMFLYLLIATFKPIIINLTNFDYRKKENIAATGLFAGTVMIFVAAMFNYVLNYYVVWLLWWSIIGLLSGLSNTKHGQDTNKENKTPLLVAGAATILVIFYLINLLDFLPEGFIPNKTKLFYFSPQVSVKTEAMLTEKKINNSPINQKEVNLLSFFHRKNPDVVYGLAELYQTTGNYRDFTDAAITSVLLDSRNTKKIYKIINIFNKNYSAEQECQLYSVLSGLYLSNKENQFFKSKHFNFYCIQTFSMNRPKINQNENISIHLARVLYLVGFNSKNTDSKTTRKLWESTVSLASNWSYYYIEYASLLWSTFEEKDRAINMITECKKNKYAKTHCNSIDLNLVKPGSFKNLIIGQ